MQKSKVYISKDIYKDHHNKELIRLFGSNGFTLIIGDSHILPSEYGNTIVLHTDSFGNVHELIPRNDLDIIIGFRYSVSTTPMCWHISSYCVKQGKFKETQRGNLAQHFVVGPRGIPTHISRKSCKEITGGYGTLGKWVGELSFDVVGDKDYYNEGVIIDNCQYNASIELTSRGYYKPTWFAKLSEIKKQ